MRRFSASGYCGRWSLVPLLDREFLHFNPLRSLKIQYEQWIDRQSRVIRQGRQSPKKPLGRELAG
jgi:hypothetical protein